MQAFYHLFRVFYAKLFHLFPFCRVKMHHLFPYSKRAFLCRNRPFNTLENAVVLTVYGVLDESL